MVIRFDSLFLLLGIYNKELIVKIKDSSKMMFITVLLITKKTVIALFHKLNCVPPNFIRPNP